MRSTRKGLPASYFVVTGVAILAIAGIAIAFVMQTLSPREFSVAVLVLMAAMFVAFLLVFRRMRTLARASDQGSAEIIQPLDAVARKRIVRQIRRLQIMVALFVFCLLWGIWTERHGPYLPVVVGCVMNLAFVTGMVLTIRRLRKTLE